MNMIWVLVKLILMGHGVKGAVDIYKQCSPISEPICQDILYTQTKMPTSIDDYSQIEARKRIRDYIPLINIRCSNYLRLFLCSVYFPMCDAESVSLGSIVKPCRPLCIHVKERCEPFMRESLQLSWPNELDCNKFPVNDTGCLIVGSFNLDEPELKKNTPNEDMNFEQMIENYQINRWIPRLKCLPSEVNIGLSTNASCSQLCFANVQFNEFDKIFAKVWLMGWSILCFFSCFLTIVVFSCNTARFLYPEKPIIFLSICYFFYATGYLLGGILGRTNIACLQFDDHTSFLVGKGRETTWCKINFLMVYFFGSASSLWWVILTITWFLSASRQWGNEAIESISSILHLLSWAIPALKSIFILILHKIDADELTGQCFVGNSNPNVLMGFVILPLIIYLVTGIFFLTIGYISLLTVRKSFKRRPNSMDKCNLKRLEKLMAKIGVFSILYIVPVICTIVSYIIDVYKMKTFKIAVNVLNQLAPNCVTKNGISWSQTNCVEKIQPMLPSVEMRMLRIFMNLVIGITSGVWIWGNSKTLMSCIGAIKFWGDIKDKPRGLMSKCDSLTKIKEKDYILPYMNRKLSSSELLQNEPTLPILSAPSEIIIGQFNHHSPVNNVPSRH